MLVTLLKSLRAYWRNAFYWGVCMTVGSLMPLWITLLFRRIYRQPYNFGGFVLHGDLVLYAAAFLAPAIYQVTVRMREDESILQVGAVVIGFVALLVSTVVYVVLSPELGSDRVPQLAPDYDFLNSLSWGLLLLAFVFSVCVFLNEQQLVYSDLKGAEEVDQKILSVKVEEHNPAQAPATVLAPETEMTEERSEDALKAKFKAGDNG